MAKEIDVRIGKLASSRCLLFATTLLALPACNDSSSPAAPAIQSSIEISPTAAEYLNFALDIIQNNSIKRREIDWPTFRSRSFEFAQGAQTPQHTHGAIRFALEALGDNHSFFIPPERTLAEISPSGVPDGQLLGEAAYLALPGFSEGDSNGSRSIAFAEKVQEIIRSFDAPNRCGWIVDLRTNTGGNMWPMLAGIGPVLGEGVAGSFVGVEEDLGRWFYRAGASGIEASDRTTTLTEVAGPGYRLFNATPPVAVLIGRDTASSGEGVAIAFRGRPMTRSFGSSTFGISTANSAFPLSDGATLVLTTAIMADRTGTIYGNAVDPDEFVAGFLTEPQNDLVVTRALEWLKERCR